MTLAEQIYARLVAESYANCEDERAVMEVAAKHAVTAAVVFEDEMKRREAALRKVERSADITVADRIPAGEDAIVDQLDRIGDTLKLIRDEMPS